MSLKGIAKGMSKPKGGWNEMIMTVVLGTINTFFAIASGSVHAIILLHSDDIGKHSVEGSFARVGGCT